MKLTKDDVYSYKDHPLYGFRILHFLSPVRWNTAKEFVHGSDSNYKAVERTIGYLPMCHHYIMVPKKHKIPNDRVNVTLIEIEYPTSVLLNRATIDKQGFGQGLNLKWTDVDFVFCHQPELLYNIYSFFQGKRGGNLLKAFSFFHWVDCDKSRPMEKYPPGFYRQLDAIHISDKAFFHSPTSWKEYFFSNFGKNKLIAGLNEDVFENKISYMPVNSDLDPNQEDEPFELPTDKKIILFNSRWNSTTGKDKFVEYTKNIDFDKYFIWVTDEEFNRTMGRSVLPPEYMYVKALPFKQYLYLMKNVHCTVSFVDQYQTWNLSLQDGLKFNKPVVIYKHPTVEHIIGPNYPYYFSNKKEFEKVLESLPETIDWPVPDHEKTFKDNVINSMLESVDSLKISKVPNNLEMWLYHLLKGTTYKGNILQNITELFGSHNWENMRVHLLKGLKLKDDPTESYTRYEIPEERREELETILSEIVPKNQLEIDYKRERIDKKFPPNSKLFNTKKHKSLF